MSTPASLGFRMPAEWEPHRRCWMAWPCREELWGDRMDAARAAYSEVGRAVARFEPVTMICNPGDVAEASLACGPGIEVMSMSIDDSWLRDTGPTFLVDETRALGAVSWRFNGWGNVYQDYRQDAGIASQIAEKAGARRFDAPLVLEGGAIMTDGEGTMLAVETSILDAKRNPHLIKGDVEALLKAYTGIEKVLWLPRGYEDDETLGHVDEVACFARPGLVLALTTADREDPNHDSFQENLAALRAATDARGRPLEVVEVPQPGRRARRDGRRLTLSYVNLYIANGGVVMPSFEAAEDDRAYRIVRDAFPGRRVVQVPATDIVQGGGGIHCITQQEPMP